MNGELFRGVEINALPDRERQFSERYLGFPEDLTFNEFRLINPEIRKQIILRNPIIQSDTYNRTMEHLAGEDLNKEGVYVLQLRKAKSGFLIATGIQDVVNEIANVKITQAQLDFAKDYYAQSSGVPYFNPEKWETVIRDHGGKLPFEIYGVKEGTSVLPGDPILRVHGPNELVAHFEPYFHRIFYPTLVATNARRIAEIIDPSRFIEVGLRGVENNDKHLIAVKAMYIGGGIRNTSSDMANAYYPQFNLIGTIGHRYIQSFVNEEEAFRHAVENLPAVTLLVDLNDSYEGIEKALRIKREYRNSGKKIWMRLDSGDLLAECVYALRRQEELGLKDPELDKIVIEGIESIEQLEDIESKLKMLDLPAEDYVIYGAGGLLVSENTARCDASSGFKLAKYDGRPTAKFTNSSGKSSIPGVPFLGELKGERIISQSGEHVRRSLFQPYYIDKKVVQPESIEIARINAGLTYEEIAEQAKNNQRTQKSYQTSTLLYDLRPKSKTKETVLL